jgi:hypothetical protein
MLSAWRCQPRWQGQRPHVPLFHDQSRIHPPGGNAIYPVPAAIMGIGAGFLRSNSQGEVQSIIRYLLIHST